MHPETTKAPHESGALVAALTPPRPHPQPAGRPAWALAAACSLALLLFAPAAAAVPGPGIPIPSIHIYEEHDPPSADVPPPAQDDTCENQSKGLDITWLGQRNEVCLDQTQDSLLCVSDYLNGAALSERVCLDPNGSGNLCLSSYTAGTASAVDRTCVDKDDAGKPCISHYVGGDSARACFSNDGNPLHTCVDTYVDGTREDRTCLDETANGEPCASTYLSTGDSARVCADHDGSGNPCGTLFFDGGQANRACQDQDPSGNFCVSDYALGGAAEDHTCYGSYPEGFCASHSVGLPGNLLEDRACTGQDEGASSGTCVSDSLYLGGAFLAQDRTCAGAYPEGPVCAAHRVTILTESAEERACLTSDPTSQPGTPCVRNVAFRNGVAVEDRTACQPTVAPCEPPQIGVNLNGQPVCLDNPCPNQVDLSDPSHVAVICGNPVDDPCPQRVDPNYASACGTVLCPSGTVDTSDPSHVAVVCGNPVDTPCAQGVDTGTVAACGVGPACPAGVFGDGAGQAAVLCGVPVPNPLPGILPYGVPGASPGGTVPAIVTPDVPGTTVNVPPVVTPATCTVSVCTAPTPVLPATPVTVPGVTVPGSADVCAAAPVLCDGAGRICAPLQAVCINPFGSTKVTDPTTVTVPAVTAPALCSVGVPCLPSTTVFPGAGVPVPGVGPMQVTPPVTVSVVWTGLGGTVSPNVGTYAYLPAQTVQVGPVPVTVCGSHSCPVPAAPGAHGTGKLTVTVTVGTQPYSQEVPIGF
ncbi:MAG: hypothetical protein QOG31_794 [Thermoplasmata archaeon]|jgi:hypothetical protein|nr:hypothetical protein [Thermoplasmata archaeon]